MKGKKLPHKRIGLKTENVFAEISFILRKEGNVTVNGYLADQNGIRLDEDISGTKNANSEAEKDIVAEVLAKDLEKKLLKKRGLKKASPSVGSGDSVFKNAYFDLTEDQKKTLIPESWHAPRTISQGLSYFEAFLGLLDNKYSEFDDFDDPVTVKQIMTDLRARSEKHLREMTKKDDPNVEKRFNIHLGHLDYQYAAFRKAAEENGTLLPQLSFNPAKPLGILQEFEQIKALSMQALLKLSALFHKLNKTNGLVCGGVIMECAMARPAEACAPLWKNIVFFEDYALYCIVKQADGSIVSDYVKTQSAYRCIIIPKFGRDMLFERKEWLKSLVDENGDRRYPDDKLENMPAVSKADNPELMAEPEELSAFVKDLLSQLGCSKDFWATVDKMIENEPDRDSEGKILRDPTAYVLRRNACTWYCNAAGMNPFLVDALMGHKLPKSEANWANIIRREDEWPLIAEMMERVVLDQNHSAHPGFRPIKLQKDSNGEIIPYTRFLFEAEEDMTVYLGVTACEYDDPIKIILPRKANKLETPDVAPKTVFPDSTIGETAPKEGFSELEKKKNRKHKQGSDKKEND